MRSTPSPVSPPKAPTPNTKNQSKDALIYSEKSFSPKAKSSKINILDSRRRGNDGFFSASLIKGQRK